MTGRIDFQQLPTKLQPIVPAEGLALYSAHKERRKSKGGIGGTTYLAKGLRVTYVYRFRKGKWTLTKTY